MLKGIYFGGEWQKSSKDMEVVNPYNGETISSVARAESFDPETDETVWEYKGWPVRRHINWNKHGPDLKEDLAHLVQDIKRRICGVASAGFPSFSV